MKLHLPKGLLVAVMAAIGTPSYAVNTGWAGNTLYLYGGATNGVNRDGFGVVSHANNLTSITSINASSSEGGANKTGKITMWADETSSAVTIENFLVNEGTTISAGINGWGSDRHFSPLIINEYAVVNEGAASVEVVDTGHNVVINKISGSLSSVHNAGTLSLGSAGNTTTINGTINNTGSLSLNGAIMITGIENATRKAGTIIHYSKDGGTTTSVSGNGFAYSLSNEYYLVQGNGDVKVAADTITVGSTSGISLNKTSESVTFTYGEAVGSYSSEYYVFEDETLGLSTASQYILADTATLTFSDTISSEISANVDGNGTVKVTFATGNHSKGIDLGSEFGGTISVVSGNMQIGKLLGGTDTKLELISGQTWNNATVGYDILLNAANLDSSYDFAYSTVKLNGKITGNYLRVTGTDGGSLTLTNTENDIEGIKVTGRNLYMNAGKVGTITQTGGASYVSGGTVGTITQTGGSSNVSGGTVGHVSMTGGTLNLTGTATIDGSVETGTSRLAGLYLNGGTTNIGNGTDEARITATRVEMGDDRAGTLNVNQNATLIVTGADVDGSQGSSNKYWETGFLLGEWRGQSTLDVAGRLLVQNAHVAHGDTLGIINIKNGGFVATKGIHGAKNHEAVNTNGRIQLNLEDGGKLILGEGGIDASNLDAKLGAGTIGISADAAIADNISLSNSETGTTFDTQKYVWSGEGSTTSIAQGEEGGTLTISGVISDYTETTTVDEQEVTTTHSGKLVKDGAGTLILSGANTYTGGTEIRGGTLALNGAGRLGTGEVSIKASTLELRYGVSLNVGSIKMSEDSVINMRNGNDGTLQADITIDGSGTLKAGEYGHETKVKGSIGGSGSLKLQQGDYDNTWSVNSAIRDGLSVEANANVSLTSENTYTGGTTISGRTLTTGHASALGTGKVSLEGGILKLAAALSVSAMDYVSESSQVQLQANNLEVTGTLSVGENVGMQITGSGATTVNTLQLNAGSSISTEGALSMTNLSMGKGSSMAANETIQLNGTLTLGSGIKLTGSLLTKDALDALGTGEKLEIFSGITQLNFMQTDGATRSSSATVAYTEPVDFNDVFSVEGVEAGMYELTFSDGTLWASQMNIPEPATTTLSLLALAGLCARRRRKS